MIAIELNSDSTMADLREVLGRVRKPERMLKAIAKRAEDELKGYFRTRDLTSPNKLGGERKHFWQQVADSVTGEVDEAGSTVRLGIAHPHFAQKLYGGVIRAKSARALTIPVVLKASVNQAADPEALPDMEALGKAVVEAVSEEFEK